MNEDEEKKTNEDENIDEIINEIFGKIGEELEKASKK